MKKLSRENISRVFEASELIASLDKNDPHYLLKIQNILKGYTHNLKAEENNAALHRTERFQTIEEFKAFFKDRVSAHGETAEKWFTSEMDGVKLKHFYQGFPKPKECTSKGKECRCWEIK